MSISDVLILAGGRGSRLKSVKGNNPKCLVQVIKNKLFIEYVLENLEKYKFKKVYLSIKYKKNKFLEFIKKNNSKYNFKLNYIIDDKFYGTGGAIKNFIKKKKIKKEFLVINGDTYNSINLNKFVRKSNKKLLISLKEIDRNERYGAVKLDKKIKRIIGFYEKISKSQKTIINTGTYLVHPKIFKNIKKKTFSIEQDFFPKLCKNKSITYYLSNENFIDIGIPKDYEKFKKYAKKISLK